jgi:hypothetical protein
MRLIERKTPPADEAGGGISHHDDNKRDDESRPEFIAAIGPCVNLPRASRYWGYAAWPR